MTSTTQGSLTASELAKKFEDEFGTDSWIESEKDVHIYFRSTKPKRHRNHAVLVLQFTKRKEEWMLTSNSMSMPLMVFLHELGVPPDDRIIVLRERISELESDNSRLQTTVHEFVTGTRNRQ